MVAHIRIFLLVSCYGIIATPCMANVLAPQHSSIRKGLVFPLLLFETGI